VAANPDGDRPDGDRRFVLATNLGSARATAGAALVPALVGALAGALVGFGVTAPPP
jgi:hypothetical protein